MKARYILTTGGALALGAALLLDGPVAKAFPFETSWHLAASGETAGTPKNRAGAGGIYGLGSPNEFGIRCDHCHIDAEAAFQVQITATPDFITQGNSKLYVPGQQYDIQVAMIGEVHDLNPQNGPTLNGFAASFESPDGTPLGTLVASNGSSDNCPPTAPAGVNGPTNRTMVYGDCHGVIYEPQAGDTSWNFQWIAPSAGAGDLTMWYGVVDGNQQGASSLEDDTVQGRIDLQEM